MANIVPNLAQLAEQINAEHTAALTAARTALEHARRAGGLLAEAKAACGHGNWLPWLEANVRFSERTAQAYMRVAKHRPELEAKAQATADLTIEDGLKLLAAPQAKDAPAEPPATEEELQDRVQQWRRQLWVRQWREAGVPVPAATGQEYRERLTTGPDNPFTAVLKSLPADEAVWEELLYHRLAGIAAAYRLRTKKRLPSPAALHTRHWQGWAAEPNRLVLWDMCVSHKVGGFLAWCEAAGLTDKRGGACFPEELSPRYQDALHYDLKRSLGWDDKQPFTDEDAAQWLECPLAELSTALHHYAIGHYHGFFADVLETED
jgi:hypothetical protein